LGLTSLGGYGYYLLLSDYEQASAKLVESVKNLESSTHLVSTYSLFVSFDHECLNELEGIVKQISSQLEKIQVLEKRLASVESTQVSSKRLDGFRNEYKKLSDSQHLDLIDLKAHVWSIGKKRNSMLLFDKQDG